MGLGLLRGPLFLPIAYDLLHIAYCRSSKLGGLWHMAYRLWHTTHGMPSMAYGPWLMAYGLLHVVPPPQPTPLTGKSAQPTTREIHREIGPGCI